MRHSQRFRKGLRCRNLGRSSLAVCTHTFGQEKTFIGRSEKGFDFLGYQFQTEGLHPCIRTRLNYRVRIARLYEQGAQKTRIEQYRRRWRAWVKGGLDDRVSPSPRLSGVDFLLNHGSALDRWRVN